MPPDAHPSLSRSMATENRRQPASRTQNARPLSPLPENASAIHRWKIFPFRTGRQGESAFLLSPRSGAQPPPRKTTSPPMAAFPTWQRRCFRRQYAPRQRPSFHAKVPDANGNPQRALLPSNMPRHGSGPASPVNAPGMRSGSQRSMRAWRHASPILYLCATGVSTPLFQNLADCRNGSHIHELLCAIARRTALSRPPQQGASRPATVMEYTSLPESIRESFPAQSTPSSFGQPITVAWPRMKSA